MTDKTYTYVIISDEEFGPVVETAFSDLDSLHAWWMANHDEHPQTTLQGTYAADWVYDHLRWYANDPTLVPGAITHIKTDDGAAYGTFCYDTEEGLQDHPTCEIWELEIYTKENNP